jgi:hypothetical protein
MAAYCFVFQLCIRTSSTSSGWFTHIWIYWVINKHSFIHMNIHGLLHGELYSTFYLLTENIIYFAYCSYRIFAAVNIVQVPHTGYIKQLTFKVIVSLTSHTAIFLVEICEQCLNRLGVYLLPEEQCVFSFQRNICFLNFLISANGQVSCTIRTLYTLLLGCQL